MKYMCGPCGYIYDEDVGDPTQDVPPGTPFSRLPEGWVCPDCGLGKADFVMKEM